MNPCHGYRMSRRSMLGASGATLFGLQIADLLAHAGTAEQAKAEHVIFFWNGGGMSHLDTWDPKPGRSTQGEFSRGIMGLGLTMFKPATCKPRTLFIRDSVRWWSTKKRNWVTCHPSFPSVVVHLVPATLVRPVKPILLELPASGIPTLRFPKASLRFAATNALMCSVGSITDSEKRTPANPTSRQKRPLMMP